VQPFFVKIINKVFECPSIAALIFPTVLLLYSKLYLIISYFAKYRLSYSITNYWFSRESNIYDCFPKTDLLTLITLLRVLIAYSMFSLIWYKSVVWHYSNLMILFDSVSVIASSFNFFNKFCLNIKFYYCFCVNVLLAVIILSTLLLISLKLYIY
jgi:hypothetical protein